jgi:hypothetical protein
MEILIWDLTSCAVIRRLQGHSDIVSGLVLALRLRLGLGLGLGLELGIVGLDL